MKFLITKKDMEISHIIQGQIIKIGKEIKIINNIKIIDLINGNITKTMEFGKTTQSVFVGIRKDMLKETILYGRKF
jgi:hypothetical protein